MQANIWLAGFALVNIVVILSSLLIWSYVARRGDWIDDLIVEGRSGRALGTWLMRQYRLRRQITLPILGVVTGCLFLVIVREDLSEFADVGAMSFVSVAWTSFLAGNSLFWLFVAPHATWTIARSYRLALWWYDPASTPGLRALSEGLGFTAVVLVSATALTAICGFVAPSTVQIPAVRLLLVLIFTTLICALILSVVIPLDQIRRVIRRLQGRLFESTGVEDTAAWIKRHVRGFPRGTPSVQARQASAGLAVRYLNDGAVSRSHSGSYYSGFTHSRAVLIGIRREAKSQSGGRGPSTTKSTNRGSIIDFYRSRHSSLWLLMGRRSCHCVRTTYRRMEDFSSASQLPLPCWRGGDGCRVLTRAAAR